MVDSLTAPVTESYVSGAEAQANIPSTDVLHEIISEPNHSLSENSIDGSVCYQAAMERPAVQALDKTKQVQQQ